MLMMLVLILLCNELGFLGRVLRGIRILVVNYDDRILLSRDDLSMFLMK